MRQETEESGDSLGQPSVGSRQHAALRLERENRLVVQGLKSTILTVLTYPLPS